jgi:RNA polymerase sigma-54 factor
MLQTHRQSMRPLTTAHLAQTMTLLSLTADELKQQIESELASNPALEMTDERRCPNCQRPLPGNSPCPSCSSVSPVTPDEAIVFISPRDDFHPSRGLSSDDDRPDDNIAPVTEDLPTYVFRQIAPDVDPQKRTIAAYLLTHLNEDGLLTISPVEIAQYHHVPLDVVESVRSMIQHAEPLGVGSRTPQEAMLIQLDQLSETRVVPAMTREAIEKGLNLLSRRQYSDLAHLLGISVREARELALFISENLNPFPGRSHWGDVHAGENAPLSVYRSPDVIISHINDDPSKPLMVEIIMPLAGTLRVNPLFRNALRQTSEYREEWKNDLERAALFVKCLQQRNHTMRRLMQRLVSIQKEFILHGEVSLKPLTRASLSIELEVHESTISRAVSSKTVQLPNRRIIPMSKFFDRSLNLRTILKNIIVQEGRPLSDSELVKLLDARGFKIARRTVAKYRAMEGILPAHLRHA